jgi:hypothetical protein
LCRCLDERTHKLIVYHGLDPAYPFRKKRVAPGSRDR